MKEQITIPIENDQAIIEELKEPTEELFNIHLSRARSWYPYEVAPWQLLGSFDFGTTWSPEVYPLSEGLRSAVLVNLLTEDNLPYYTNTIMALSKDHPLTEWTKRWTAEEWRHSDVIRDWAYITGALDPQKLEDARMIQMSKGQVPNPETVVEMLAYTSFQELATNVAHRNTGQKLGRERFGAQVMGTVAGDERLHHMFYRGLSQKAIEVDPSTMVLAIARQLRGFRMPGTGIPNFRKHDEAIIREGIFDLSQVVDSVFRPTLDFWEFDQLEGLSDVAEAQRNDLLNDYLPRLGRLALRQQEQVERRRQEV